MINISLRGIKRAVRYEENVRTSDKKIIKDCMIEMDKRIGEGEVSRWERKRRESLDWAGISERELKKIREEENGETAEEKIGKGIMERTEEERTKRKEESRYNELYKEIRGDTIPKYLEDRRKAKDRSMIARFRTGNEMNARLHWMKQEDKMCRICGEKEEKVEHVIYECVETISIRQNLFDEERKGLEQMKEIVERRKEVERRREEKARGED